MVPAPVSLLRLVKVVFVLLALGEKVFASRYLLVKIDGGSGGGGGVAAASDGMVVTQLGGVGRRPRQSEY